MNKIDLHNWKKMLMQMFRYTVDDFPYTCYVISIYLPCTGHWRKVFDWNITDSSQ